jgi:hypothetical protein
MKNQEDHNGEIQFRLDSNAWDEKIAVAVTKRFERKQIQNRILISFTTLILLGAISAFSYLGNLDILDSNLAELDSYRLFLSDDITPIYDTIYQEERISNLIEPISLLVK